MRKVDESPYGRAGSLLVLGFSLFWFAILIFAEWMGLRELDAEKVTSVNVLLFVKSIYELGGASAVLGLAILFAAAGSWAALRSRSMFRTLRNKMGDDAYMQLKFERARAYAAERGGSGRMPSYLESKDALAAYYRRLWVWFSLLCLVFGSVGIAVLMDWV